MPKYCYFVAYVDVPGPWASPFFRGRFFEIDQDVWSNPLGLKSLEQAIRRYEEEFDKKWNGRIMIINFIPDPTNPHPG